MKSPPDPPEIVVVDEEGFVARAADEVTMRLRFALAERGVVSLALAGGATPRPVYRALADSTAGVRPDEWNRVHFFWSDERLVAAGDPGSNVVAAAEDLLVALDLPAANIHAPSAANDAAESAAAYERELRRALAVTETPPRIDLVLLGLGSDGHTASLFSDQLKGRSAVSAGAALIVATRSPMPPHDRISFSFELLEAARHVVFLVSGESKAEVVRRVLEIGDPSLPATRINSRSGPLCWVLDSAAASRLPASRRNFDPPG